MKQNNQSFAQRVGSEMKTSQNKNKSFGNTIFIVLGVFILIILSVSEFSNSEKISDPRSTLLILPKQKTDPSGFTFFDFGRKLGDNQTLKYVADDSGAIFTIRTQDGVEFTQNDDDFNENGYDSEYTGIWIKTDKTTLTRVKIFPTKK